MRDLVLSKLNGAGKVLILGFGREGRSTFKWFREMLPEIGLAIADKNRAIAGEFSNGENKPVLHLGDDYTGALSDYDVIIKSPGIRIPDTCFEKRTVLSQTSLFLERYSRQIIGITGTKGKSTTASLTAHILKKSGTPTLLMGNIGVPAFDKLKEISPGTTIVYELSAHQLRDVKTSPRIAVLTNIFPEHLDFFDTFQSYEKAKRNIFRFQKGGDFAFDGTKYQNSDYNNEILFKAIKEFVKEPVSIDLIQQHTPLKGRHNLFNTVLSLAAAKATGLDIKEVFQHLDSFTPLPHRLEFAGIFKGISFYNDSISTVPQSAMAAVNSLNNVDVLILGGYDRGIDYSGLSAFLEKKNIPWLFFLGKAGQVIYNQLSKTDTASKLITADNMEEAVKKLMRLKNIKTVLLSPAAASYDEYHNFEHRGDTFKYLVKKYFEQKEITGRDSNDQQ